MVPGTGPVGLSSHLVEPRALQDEQARPGQLQNKVASDEHLQHGAGRASEHSHQQQGVDVSVQRFPAVHVEIKQKPWSKREITNLLHHWDIL